MSEAPRVLIVGAGWIGRQVGLRMAICGLHVAFVDKKPQVLQDAERWMQASSAEYIACIAADLAHRHAAPDSTQGAPSIKQAEPLHDGLATWNERTEFVVDVDKLHGRVEVVLECVSEQIGLKRRILREFSQRFPKPTIIASNSSYFTPSTLCEFVESPERFAHWHFHVPLYRSSIADVAGHPGTEDSVLDRLVELSQRIDQYPLRLRHEQPGYVFNWLLQSVLRSALELAARDVVDIADIDRAWKAVSGMTTGPFAMMDNIGLDVIEQVLANARWDDREPVPIDQLLAILREPISRGDLGVKSGRGFYRYE